MTKRPNTAQRITEVVRRVFRNDWVEFRRHHGWDRKHDGALGISTLICKNYGSIDAFEEFWHDYRPAMPPSFGDAPAMASEAEWVSVVGLGSKS